MNFIFMLTRDDQTVADCRDVAAELAESGVSHIGFKDIGVAPEILRSLHADLKAMGATTYLEVVSTTPEDALASARFAVEIGVDRLMGGTLVAETLEILAGSGIQYFPFPGRPIGHPTVLDGTADDVAADARRFQEMGCAGVDLLAYRTSRGDPLALVRAARSAIDGELIVAGSIRSGDQVRELARAGVEGFTVGSAIFAGELDPHAGTMRSQLARLASWLDSTEAGRQ